MSGRAPEADTSDPRAGEAPPRRRPRPEVLTGPLRRRLRAARRRLLRASAALLLLPDAAGAQAGGPPPAERTAPVDPLSVPRPTLAVHATDAEIRLDGRLDEAVWQEADSAAGPFWLAIPRQGVPQEFPTTVRVLQRGEVLYVGAVLYDPEPERIVTAGLEQDFETQDSDLFGITLDTYHDRSNGFVWAVNPRGAVFDAQAFNDSREIERAWEGVVEARTAALADGWSVELAIPLTTLRYRPSAEPQTWGMNFFRRVRRRNEDGMWAALPRQFRPYKFSLAGTLTGVRASRPGRNLGVKPYALAANTAGGAVNDATTGDLGVDAKWGITPRLTLDATVNTDFSQVELDQEQVNLTRFSLFFPEKRDFFLENEGVFAFQDVQVRFFRMGSGPRSFRLFHSRRIGLGDDRRPVPILGGARLTGRAGGFELGLLDMQTREMAGAPAENFAVARVRRELGGATLGGMVVNRQATDGGGAWNRAYGADLNWGPLPEMIVTAYGARTDYRGAAGDRNAGMLQVAWRDPLWDASVLAKHTGDGFDPGAGFVARRGVRRLFATAGAHPQPGIPGVQEVNPYVDVDWFTNLDGVMETRSLQPGLAVTFLDGSILTAEWTDRFERLFEPLPIAGGVVAPGDYAFQETSLRYMASGGRELSGTLSLSFGDFFDGRRLSWGGSGQWRPDPRFSLTVGAQRNELDIGGEELTADLYSFKAELARDIRTFLLGFVQYNEAARELVTNLRFNLIHAPLSDVFLVLTERRSLADEASIAREHTDVDVFRRVRERGVTLKVTRLLAF